MAQWTLERAEEHLLSLELFGMHFGLERMQLLLAELGSPQRRFRSLHIVGTNGKSSTTRMATALLEVHGLRAGCYLSPHLGSFAERVRVGDADVGDDDFAAAVQRAAVAAEIVDRELPEPGDRVTQFELLTAAAFDELARVGVEVAVVEAGLGGRHDATNVLDAPVVVLTNVGLEHTRWLGPTVLDIAREKLAVVRPGAALVLGDVPPEVEEEARATGARIVRPGPSCADLPGYQQQNFALARAAAEEVLGHRITTMPRVEIPGRLQVIGSAPRTILDGAHNPAGMAALARTLPDDVTAVISILDDKDAASMLGELAPKTVRMVCTASQNPRALPPATLASLAGELGIAETVIEPDPHRALERARDLAGPDGTVVAAGSIYLVADLLAAPGRRRASTL